MQPKRWLKCLPVSLFLTMVVLALVNMVPAFSDHHWIAARDMFMKELCGALFMAAIYMSLMNMTRHWN